MAKPEQRVIDYLKRRLKKFADARSMPLFIDKPPASMRGACGRPDLFVDLGPYHFRLEVKSDKGKASALQKYYFKTQSAHNDLVCHFIIGKDGVDRFVNSLNTLIDAMIERQQQDAHRWLLTIPQDK